MVKIGLAVSVLQLVALSLPAFAILFQIIVQSEFAYANRAVSVVAASFGLIVAGGTIVLTALLLAPLDPLMQIALVAIDLGLVGMLTAIYLIGFRTRKAQISAAD